VGCEFLEHLEFHLLADLICYVNYMVAYINPIIIASV
jgi:hypothetical protein